MKSVTGEPRKVRRKELLLAGGKTLGFGVGATATWVCAFCTLINAVEPPPDKTKIDVRDVIVSASATGIAVLTCTMFGAKLQTKKQWLAAVAFSGCVSVMTAVGGFIAIGETLGDID